MSLSFTPEFKDGKVFVIWKWQVLHQDGNNSEGNCCLFSANGTPDYSDAESETVTHQGCIKEKLYPEVLWKASVTKVSLYLYIEVHVDPMVVHGSFGYVVKEARDAMLAVQRRNLVDRKPHLLLMTFLLMTSWLTYLLSRVWLNAGHDHKRELVHKIGVLS